MTVSLLAVLGGMLMALGTPRILSAQAPADANPQPVEWKQPEWLLDADATKKYFKAEHWRDRSALKAANPGPEETRKIQRIVHAYLSALVHDEKANLPKSVVDKCLVELHQQLTSPAAREIAFNEIIARAPDLMNHPENLVRLNLVSMIVQMNSKPARIEAGTRVSAVPYNLAWKPLVQVLENPNQQLSCRIMAARGLMRLCRDGENAPSSNERSDIATALVDTLEATPPSSADGIWWFRLRMIETLGYVNRIDNTAKQPIVLEALLDVITNRQETFLNRAAAAESIAHLPYASDTNVPLITSEIMRLLAEMSVRYNKAPKTPGMRDAFVRIYLSFRPRTEEQAKVRKWGLLYEVERSGLASHADFVKSAWDVAFPITSPFLSSGNPPVPLPTIPGPEIQALTAWVQEHQPALRSVMPGGKLYPELTTEPQAAVGAASK